VGDYNSPNWERLAALKPDLVLLVGSADSPMLPRLEALGIPAAAFRSETFDDIHRDLALLGDLLERRDRARALSESLRVQAESLQIAVSSIPTGSRPKVFAEISDRPLMTGSDHSFLGQLISLAGGRNVAGDMLQDYAAIDPEMVVDREPDIILVLHPGTTVAEVRGRIGWSSVPAVKEGRVVAGLDLDLLMRPGPRYPLAARALYQVFHGQR
jgi:iron complex transport system substrate-binding protein